MMIQKGDPYTKLYLL